MMPCAIGLLPFFILNIMLVLPCLFSPLSLSVTPQIVERIMLPASPTLPPLCQFRQRLLTPLWRLLCSYLSPQASLHKPSPTHSELWDNCPLSPSVQSSPGFGREVITARASVVWGQQTRLPALAPIQEFNVTPANNSVSLGSLGTGPLSQSRSLHEIVSLGARVGPICRSFMASNLARPMREQQGH